MIAVAYEGVIKSARTEVLGVPSKGYEYRHFEKFDI